MKANNALKVTWMLGFLCFLLLLLVPGVSLPQWPGPGWSPSVPDMTFPLLKDLQHWWRAVPGFTGGAKLYDLVRSGAGGPADLTLTNMGYATSSGWSAGTRPGSLAQLNFDGTNDYASGGLNTTITGETSAVTICVWHNPVLIATSPAQMLVSADDGAGAFTGLKFFWSNASYPTWRYCDNSGYCQDVIWSTGSWPIISGVWQHWCVTRTGIGGNTGMAMYYNGDAQTVNLGLNYGLCCALQVVPWTLGGVCCATPGLYYQGSIDDVMLWGRALSAQELQWLYQLSRTTITTLLPPAPTLVAAPGVPGVTGKPGNFLPFFR